jgi:hypothetical protein
VGMLKVGSGGFLGRKGGVKVRYRRPMLPSTDYTATASCAPAVPMIWSNFAFKSSYDLKR